MRLEFDLSKVSFSKNDIKRNIVLPRVLDEHVAEDIGIQIGDGGIFFYKEPDGDTEYRIECYGNNIEDRLYLSNFIAPLKEKLFNIKAPVREHASAGTCFIRIRSKALVSFYHDVLKLPVGKKCQKVCIPKPIIRSRNSVLAACIRGIADTDFSLTFKSKYGKPHTYPVIHCVSASRKLVKQLSTLLERFGIDSCTNFDCEEHIKGRIARYIKHHMFTHGVENLERWINFIGFNNPVQITRYLVWKKYGHYPIKTTLEQRLEFLNE